MILLYHEKTRLLWHAHIHGQMDKKDTRKTKPCQLLQLFSSSSFSLLIFTMIKKEKNLHFPKRKNPLQKTVGFSYSLCSLKNLSFSSFILCIFSESIFLTLLFLLFLELRRAKKRMIPRISK